MRKVNLGICSVWKRNKDNAEYAWNGSVSAQLVQKSMKAKHYL